MVGAEHCRNGVQGTAMLEEVRGGVGKDGRVGPLQQDCMEKMTDTSFAWHHLHKQVSACSLSAAPSAAFPSVKA